MSEGKVCVEVGKTAGRIAKKITEGLEKAKSKTTTICEKFGDICKSPIARLEGKKKDTLTRLGTEVWSLHQEKIFKAVFSQNKVQRLVKELKEYEKEIQEIKQRMVTRKEIKEKQNMLKKARADLKSNDPEVMKEAIRVLEEIGDKTVVPYLNKVLNDPDAQVRKKAVKVLRKLADVSVKKAPVVEKKVKETKNEIKETNENENTNNKNSGTKG